MATHPAITRDPDEEKLDQLVITTIKMLAVDAVQRAHSGHPGMPMGAADYAYVLFTRFLKHDPSHPEWPDRDRFVLSAGHGSMLLYALLHLCGYDLSLEEIQRFRQFGSHTPGHPERGHPPGVEVTTGPLGQGFACGVGMALAERMLAARFNIDGHTVIDHFTYGICSDGDLMEGIQSEAASLAGHLGLGRLIYFYDDNRITIDGSTDLTFTEDVGKRFDAYGWHVQKIDAYDLLAVAQAVEAARAEINRPSLIIARSRIAHGSPNKQDTAEAHGAPLGEEEVRITRLNLCWPPEGWPEDAQFVIPDQVKQLFAELREEWSMAHNEWRDRLAAFAQAHGDVAAEFARWQGQELPVDWSMDFPTFAAEDKAVATRVASHQVLQAAARRVPNLIGGSADLASSNRTLIDDGGSMARQNLAGRNIHFGVREHAMGGILNGMAAHGGFHVFGSTFLVFSDYMRPSIRLAALMQLPVIYLFTHDSIFVGEDGPTHQPIEQVASLRAMPNLTVIRPADAIETSEAWRIALTHRSGPVALILSRQNLPVLDRSRRAAGGATDRGAYVLRESEGGARPI